MYEQTKVRYRDHLWTYVNLFIEIWRWDGFEISMIELKQVEQSMGCEQGWQM